MFVSGVVRNVERLLFEGLKRTAVQSREAVKVALEILVELLNPGRPLYLDQLDLTSLHKSLRVAEKLGPVITANL